MKENTGNLNAFHLGPNTLDGVILYKNTYFDSSTVSYVTPAIYIRVRQNMALYTRVCVSLCLSDETLKAVCPFSLVAMPGEVKVPTQGVNL